jgi:hypothetical protein
LWLVTVVRQGLFGRCGNTWRWDRRGDVEISEALGKIVM